MTEGSGRLIVHRGSRTEWLAEELARQLETQRPANPLAAQTVVVAHPGLQRWLLGCLAQRRDPRGGHGIAANYDMILPWQWFERTARRVLGDEALIGGAYRQDLLRWRLLVALPSSTSPELTHYLTGDDASRRAFQLAEHLAGVFTQYLIYRPDWILDWEQSATRHPGDWQAGLWRQIQQATRRPHRAQRSSALLEALRRGEGTRDESPLHVFGVSHLPPDVLQALQVTALHVPVHLYFPDPCREYWSDLRSRRFQLAQQGDPEALYYDIGHPLLVALGRVAQDFCITLDECDAIELRDPLDEAEPLDDAISLLAQLQSSIRCLQPELVGATVREQLAEGACAADVLPPLRDDASLRVHACHTRLRELEVLKNALLRCLADDPTLQHRDIVVMAPDISAYAPYLPAIFGEPAKYRSEPSHIPWHLADVGLARAHPLMSAFTRVLDLAESRFAVSEVLDFLDVPAVARRFAIDDAGRDLLERWVRRAHVAWGLDAQMKGETGAAATDANSWQFGLDRMLAGLIVGNDHGEGLLDGVLPLPGVSGSGVEVLGQFDRLLDELRQARSAFAGIRTLAAWSEWLLVLIDALFAADPRDEAENQALDSLRRLSAGLGSQAAEVGMETALPWSVVREALRGALSAVPERQSFLLGGVTFCGLVPQRSIPFRVVCLLGMNEGEFPRPGGDAGLNRILAQPRQGDRDTRNEDRYLFLEALMSARDVLHISYVGEGVRDGKPRNPAGPLAELLQFLDEQHGIAGDELIDRPWRVRHPLQPFDARYYERDEHGRPRHDPRWFSYDPAFVALSAPADLPRFFHAGTATKVRVDIADDAVPLASLKRYWRDPARETLQRVHGISLQALESESWPDREPLETGFDRIARIDRQLLFDALAMGRSVLPIEPPAWLARSGLMAEGAIGTQAYAQIRDSLRSTLGAAHAVFGGEPVQTMMQSVDVDLGEGLRINGVVERVVRLADGRLLWFDAKPNGAAGLRDLLGFYLDWAALRLSGHDTIEACFLEHPSTIRAARPAKLLEPVLAQDALQLRDGLRRLIQAWRGATTSPLLFFPQSALAYASQSPENRLAAASVAWSGSDFAPGGERHHAPGYAALLSRGLDLFDPQTAECQAFVAATTLVCDVLDPSHAILLKPQTDPAASEVPA